MYQLLGAVLKGVNDFRNSGEHLFDKHLFMFFANVVTVDFHERFAEIVDRTGENGDLASPIFDGSGAGENQMFDGVGKIAVFIEDT